MATRKEELEFARDAFTELVEGLDSRTFDTLRHQLEAVAEYLADQQAREDAY